MNKKEQIAKINENALLIDGLDKAIIGTGSQYGNSPVVIYDKEKCIEIIAEQFLESNKNIEDPYLDAIEWFSFNVECTYMGEHTPIIMSYLDVEYKKYETRKHKRNSSGV